MEKNTRVGVGVIIMRDGKVLLGKRKNAHGEGTWGFPGGHLEFTETPEECAIRETLEETGLQVTSVKRGPYTDDYHSVEKKHYITLMMIAHCEGEPELKEPHKCESWEWHEWQNLPNPLFLSVSNLIKNGFIPF